MPTSTFSANPRAHPPFLPTGRRARWCLGLLVTFTLLKGLIWGITIPSFWAGDEDYHFLYVDTLTTQHRLVDRERPLYPREYGLATSLIQYNTYGQGPRRDFSGDPKASIKELEALPSAARDPVEFGRGVGVIHPPLYHLLGAAVNATAGDASILTRLTVVRFLSALLGALAVYLAWLLAAQVLARFLHQMIAAFLLSIQPIFSYMTGIVNHDVALVASFNLALALMLFIVRSRPTPAQGLWLGGSLVLALLIKATALVLLPLATLAYAFQALAFRPQWREVLKSAALAAGLVLLLAGWWYVRSKIVYGSIAGAAAAYTTSSGAGAGLAEHGILNTSLSTLFDYSREWFALTYRTYWWHFLWFDAPGPSSYWFHVPLVLGTLGALGLTRVVWSIRRTFTSAADPLLRQILLLTIAAITIIVPFLGVDLVRKTDGLGFFANGGRYLLPAYAGAAVLLITGLRGLVGTRAWTPAVLAASSVALVFHLRVYDFHYLNRYYGHESIGEILRRLSFDRPEFVTPATIACVAVLAALSGAASVALAIASHRRDA